METLIVDHYDSYTYNLYQAVWRLTGRRPTVIHCDDPAIKDLDPTRFSHVVLSPGPGDPRKKEDFGFSRHILEHWDCPILGVCLGHQGIAYYYGGTIGHAPSPVHGYTSRIRHNGRGLFRDLPEEIPVMRYHSLAVIDCPEVLIPTAYSCDDGVLMAFEHRDKPIYGVQFHPESIGTTMGRTLLAHFFFVAPCELPTAPPPVSIGRAARKENVNISEKKSPAICVEKYDLEDPDGNWTERFFCHLSASGERVFWLDSSKRVPGDSRYSIFGFMGPRADILKYHSKERTVCDKSGVDKTVTSLWAYLDDVWTEQKNDDPALKDLPFTLGYIGYFGYEMKGETDGDYVHESDFPDAQWVFVDRTMVYDHEKRCCHVLHFEDDPWAPPRWDGLRDIGFEPSSGPLPRCYAQVSRKEYSQDILLCQDKIKDGESYEICLTNRLVIDGALDPVRYYRALRHTSPGQYAAYLPFDAMTVCSSSMECFLKAQGDTVRTKPIKGTLPRGKTPEQDREMIRLLREDPHYHAENVMVVDLLRNDLAKIAVQDGVYVPKLFDVESFETLHQLVTTVEAVRDPKCSVMSVIEATFPGGSMTGAPKKRTMAIIDALEKSARGVYSGALGYLSLNGNADLSIVIRTTVIEKERALLGVGGAIIAGSDPQTECDEIVLKAKGALNALKAYYGLPLDTPITIERF